VVLGVFGAMLPADHPAPSHQVVQVGPTPRMEEVAPTIPVEVPAEQVDDPIVPLVCGVNFDCSDADAAINSKPASKSKAGVKTRRSTTIGPNGVTTSSTTTTTDAAGNTSSVTVKTGGAHKAAAHKANKH
jgi:hypothetical protein